MVRRPRWGLLIPALATLAAAPAARAQQDGEGGWSILARGGYGRSLQLTYLGGGLAAGLEVRRSVGAVDLGVEAGWFDLGTDASGYWTMSPFYPAYDSVRFTTRRARTGWNAGALVALRRRGVLSELRASLGYYRLDVLNQSSVRAPGGQVLRPGGGPIPVSGPGVGFGAGFRLPSPSPRLRIGLEVHGSVLFLRTPGEDGPQTTVLDLFRVGPRVEVRF